MKTCALLLSLLLTMAGCPAWAEDEIELVTGPDRRQEIDLRIEALDARRAEISTTGPKTATFLGLGLLVAGGVTSAVAATSDGCGINDAKCPVGAIVAGLTLVGIGGITAIAGGIVWSKRVGRRDEIDAERESLIEERDGFAAALSRIELRSPYRDGTQFVTLGVRF